MAKRSAHSTYARIVGEVAIAWTELDGRLDNLASHYLALEPRVAGFILGSLGGDTKAELVKFLLEEYEPNLELREPALYIVSIANRVRENRNILGHAVPSSWSDRYQGEVWKRHKLGHAVGFEAPIGQLRELLKSIHDTNAYLKWVTFTIQMAHGLVMHDTGRGPHTAEAALNVLRSLERPLLPDKIAPLPRP